MSTEDKQPTIADLSNKIDRLEAITLIGAKNVLDIDEAVLYTGYSKGHLYRLTCTRQIPHSKRDRKLFFDKAQLDAWMTEVHIPTAAQIDVAAETYTTINKRKR